MVHAYISDLGGINQISEIKLGLLRRLAALIVQCEALESEMVKGNKVDPLALCQLSSTAMRLSLRLGLERRPKDTLAQYLNRRKEVADHALAQRLDKHNAKLK